MLNVAVIGASGYTGVELLRLLYTHPEAAVTCVTSEQSAGRKISDIFPSLRDRCDLVLEKVDAEAAAEKADLIFTALPHQAAMAVVPALLRKGKLVVDLSADYRLRDPEVYAAWYADHTSPDLLAEAVYGLPEIRRETVAGARLVANPGCYPTSVILGMAPLLQKGLIETDTIIADSKSGVTGAGRSAKVDNLFCEVNDSFKPYGVGGVHRHIPEIEQELSLLAGESITISFTPHLVPMDRGIISTIYARLSAEANTGELLDLYREFYDGEAFVRVLPEGSYPSTAFVRGSNFCDIGLAVDKRTGRVIVTTAIDNLVKGAAGQAIQNMNILADLPENMGLEGLALFP